MKELIIKTLMVEPNEYPTKRFWNTENYTDKEVSKSYQNKFEETINFMF